AQKQYGDSHDEKQYWIGVQNLFRYGSSQSFGVASPFYGAKSGRQGERICVSRPLDSHNHLVAGPRLFPDVLQKVEPGLLGRNGYAVDGGDLVVRLQAGLL